MSAGAWKSWTELCEGARLRAVSTGKPVWTATQWPGGSAVTYPVTESITFSVLKNREPTLARLRELLADLKKELEDL